MQEDVLMGLEVHRAVLEAGPQRAQYRLIKEYTLKSTA